MNNFLKVSHSQGRKGLSFFLLIVAMSFSFLAKAQLGCTDVQANNYDPLAQGNDGSCLYNITNYTPSFLVDFPNSLAENSGLADHLGLVFTHNDGGNSNLIFGFNPNTEQVESTLVLLNAPNEDWEDLAMSDQHFFVGDFGNNNGDRTDLRIFRFEKSLVPSTGSANISSEVIDFVFEDQVDFTSNSNTNFDCEAVLYFNDSLHLFTKNRGDFQVKHYVLPNQPGDQVAVLRNSFDSQGMITAADISPDGENLILVGYTASASTFFYVIFDFEGSDFFRGNKRRIDTGSFFENSQTEGVVFTGNTEGYISGESFNVFTQRLHTFDISSWISALGVREQFPANEEVIFYNSNRQSIMLEKVFSAYDRFEIYDAFGRLVQEGALEQEAKVETQAKGLLFCRCIGPEREYSFSFFK